MKRRTFIKSASLAVSALAVSNPLLADIPKANRFDFGILLSTLKKEILDDSDGVMKQQAAAGYKYVEGLGSYGIPEESLAYAVKTHNLMPVATGA